MNPVAPDITHEAYWGDYTWHHATFTAPDDPPDCTPCPALVTETEHGPVVRVAWKPDEIEAAAIADGGTIWLSTWGGLPAHSLEVQAAP